MITDSPVYIKPFEERSTDGEVDRVLWAKGSYEFPMALARLREYMPQLDQRHIVLAGEEDIEDAAWMVACTTSGLRLNEILINPSTMEQRIRYTTNAWITEVATPDAAPHTPLLVTTHVDGTKEVRFQRGDERIGWLYDDQLTVLAERSYAYLNPCNVKANNWAVTTRLHLNRSMAAGILPPEKMQSVIDFYVSIDELEPVFALTLRDYGSRYGFVFPEVEQYLTDHPPSMERSSQVVDTNVSYRAGQG